jgi:uncharacterized membrane protein
MRHHRLYGSGWGVLLGIVGLFFTASPAAAISYTITDLGALPGATTSTAVDINNAGQIVGNSGGYGFLWENGAMQSLGALPGADSSAAARINNGGQVVGSSGGSAFLWQGGAMQNLGGLPGAASSSAFGINDLGQVVGGSGGHAVLWQSGTIQELATPSGHYGSSATAINNLGQIAGTSNWSGPCMNCNKTYGVVWQNGTATPSTFLPQGAYEERVSVSRINDSGQVVGTSNQTEPLERMVGYVKGSGGPTTFPFHSSASGLNELGQVVGTQPAGPSAVGAFLWHSDTGMQALFPMIVNGSGWSINPVDINDHGWIVGTGTYDGLSRGFLLTPVEGGGTIANPEPGTLLLFGSGVAGLLARKKWRTRVS